MNRKLLYSLVLIFGGLIYASKPVHALGGDCHVAILPTTDWHAIISVNWVGMACHDSYGRITGFTPLFPSEG